jgi:glycosyltransferase involved in cell wall biosynthesis
MFGGVSDYTYHLSRSLAEKGMEICVLTSSNNKVIRNIEGSSVKVLPVIKKWGFRAIPQIIREVKNINPDWVLLQYVPYMYNYYGIPVWIAILAFLLRFKNHKLVTTFHEVAIKFDVKKPKYWGIAIVQRLIAYSLCFASYKMIVSIERYRMMLGMFRKRIYRIPIGSNILQINVSNNDKKELKRKIASDKEIIISTFGTKAAWGGNSIFLRAIKRYIDNFDSSIKVLFIGGTSTSLNGLKTIAKQLNLEKYCFFTGELAASEIFFYLAVSDLFVQIETYSYGGISTKSCTLASAYAAGLPIIGNNGELTDNFFKDGENIILIDEKELDPLTIAQKIHNALNDKTLLLKLREGSKKTYTEYLSWDRISNMYREILCA